MSRFRPQLLELENRVVPSASAKGLDSALLPPPAITLPVMQISAEVQVHQDGNQGGRFQGIDEEFSLSINTTLPRSTDMHGSGGHGIVDRVSGEVQVLQMGRQSNGFQGIGQDLRIFIFTILPNSTDQQGFSNQGFGDLVSTEAQLFQDVQQASGFQLFASVSQQDTGTQGPGVDGSIKTQIVQTGHAANALIVGTPSTQTTPSNSTDPPTSGNQADAANAKSQVVTDASKAGKTQGNTQSVVSSTVSLLSNLTDAPLHASPALGDAAIKAQTGQDSVLVNLQTLFRDQESARNLSNYFHSLHTQASEEPEPPAPGTPPETNDDSAPGADRAPFDDLDLSEITGESLAGLLGMAYFAMPTNPEDRDSKERKRQRRRP
jgi:hypothetical protein